MRDLLSKELNHLRKICSIIIVFTFISTMSPSIAKAVEPTEVFTIVDGVLTKYNGTDSEVTVPDGVTGIGEKAFANNVYIQKIILPNSVTSIGLQAFLKCSKLETIVFPSSLTRIASLAFDGCVKLGNIIIPSGIQIISVGTFNNCESLKSVILPDTVKEIDWHAFSNCSSLTNIKLPSGLTRIGDASFCYCTSLENITIPDTVTTIEPDAFSSCTKLRNIIIPASVESIGSRAFYRCPNITLSSDNHHFIYENKILYNFDKTNLISCYDFVSSEITVDASVKSILSGAFSFCSNLRNIIIPEGVESIDSAFGGCNSINIKVPKSVLHIGPDAFYGCSDFTLICYEKSAMEEYAIQFGIPYLLADRCTITSEIQGNGRITPSGKVQAATGSSITFNIAADSGYTIWDVLVDNVSQGKINTYTFNNIVADHKIKANFSVSVTPKPTEAPTVTPSITPTPTTSPSGSGDNSGGGYPGGGGGFPGGGFSGGLVGAGNEQPSITPTVTPSVKPTPSITPKQEGTASFPKIGKIITDSKSNVSYAVTEVDENRKEVAFAGAKEKIRNLVIPSSIQINSEEYQVSSIKRKALYNNKDLKTVTLGTNITEINDYAFAKCSELTQVIIGKNVTEIGASAFKECTKLNKITIPNGTEKIGDSAFASCNSLSSITLGSNVESLGKNIFYGDQNLTKIIIRSTKLKAVDEKAFSNMSGDLAIYVPASKFDEYKELLKNKGQKKTVKVKSLNNK